MATDDTEGDQSFVTPKRDFWAVDFKLVIKKQNSEPLTVALICLKEFR